MALMINTNMYSLNASRNLTKSQGGLETSLQRLSSGLRINGAKDDAAGLAIASRMTSQVRGLDQAARNANDGISAAQTAEGALRQSSDILQRIRELAVQSANDTNTASDRASLQAEVSQLQQELNATANNTAFNGKKLLDGTFSGQTFQVGANAGQTISISIASARATDIGNHSVAIDGTMNAAVASAAALPAANNVAAQTLTISGSAGSATVGVLVGQSAGSIAAAVNGISASTGVTATASTTATLSGIGVGTASFALSGAGGTAVTVSANIVDAADMSSLANAINNVTSTTGITAATNGGTITLTSSTGDDIGIADYTNTGADLTAAFAGGSGAAQVLTSGAATDSSRVGGSVSFSSSAAYNVATSATGTMFTATNNASALAAVSSVNIGTQAGATAALAVLDGALGGVNTVRGALGAVQNRFENTIANLATSSENLKASRSRIEDADFAQETAALTRSQVMQQAGMAMLAQANQVPQGVLALLRG